MLVKDSALLLLIMLMGAEGRDYWIHERSAEEWRLVAWIHRN